MVQPDAKKCKSYNCMLVDFQDNNIINFCHMAERMNATIMISNHPVPSENVRHH